MLNLPDGQDRAIGRPTQGWKVCEIFSDPPLGMTHTLYWYMPVLRSTNSSRASEEFIVASAWKLQETENNPKAVTVNYQYNMLWCYMLYIFYMDEYKYNYINFAKCNSFAAGALAPWHECNWCCTCFVRGCWYVSFSCPERRPFKQESQWYV